MAADTAAAYSGLPEARGLYLLHFEPGYLHARHYLGYANSIARRVAEHRSLSAKASPLVRAAIGSGSAVHVARVWRGGTRVDERRLKRQGGLSRHCPICRSIGRYHR